VTTNDRNTAQFAGVRQFHASVRSNAEKRGARDGKRFIVRADEKLSAFVELERQVLTVTFYLEILSCPFVPVTMTVIEIRSHRSGWKAFASPGVEPVFPKKDQAIDYAQNRACFRSGEVWVFDATGTSSASFRSTTRSGSCENDAIDTHDGGG